MRRLALIAFASFVVASGARAQEITRLTFDNLEVFRFNSDDCTGPAMEQLLEATLPGPQYFLRYVAYDRGVLAECPTNRTEILADQLIDDRLVVPANGALVDRVNIERSLLMGDACTINGGDRTARIVCAQIFVQQTDLDAVATATVSVDSDTTTPPTATISAVNSGDSLVSVVVDDIGADDPDSYTFIVQSRLCAEGEGEGEGEGEVAGEGEGEGDSDVESICGATGAFDETKGAGPSIDVDAVNGRGIEVRVIAVDDFGNRGAPSDLVEGIAIADLSPLDLYDGGANALSCDPGSCDSSSAAFGVPVGLFFLLRRRRRSDRRGVGALLMLATLAVSTSAAAQTNEAIKADERRPWPGLGRSTVALNIGSYKPNLDSNSSFPIYGCFFDDKTLLRIGGEGDFHIVDVFGSLQLSVGFDAAQANGFAQPAAAQRTGTCQDPTTTAVQLTMASVRPGLTYRLDPLLDWWNVPLVPYGRLGFVVEGYLFSKGGEVATKSGDENPVGLRYGGEAALGLMLALDFLDYLPISPGGTTKRARANGLLDHSFLYVEGAAQDVTSFGASGFDFSPNDAGFLKSGLPITWKVGIAVELL